VRQVQAQVISNEPLWAESLAHEKPPFSGVWLMWLKCPDVASEAKPGQFIMVNCGPECPLHRPLSVHQVNDEGDIAIFYAVLKNGRGTPWLAKRKPLDDIGLFGPLGNGYHIYPESRNLLLVAGGNGIAPLYFLAQAALQQSYSATLLYGTAGEKRCPISPAINLVSCTEDGTVGYSGRVTDLIREYIERADQIFACGPLPMYQTMAQMPELKDKPVQVSLEVRMGCGLGVCYGCTIKTKQGLRQVCQDGPVFNLEDIIWEELSPI
jgi:dihydroorotate dehydrogenase electron transfer subunit